MANDGAPPFSGDSAILTTSTIAEMRDGSGVFVNLDTREFVEVDRMGSIMWQAVATHGSIDAAVSDLGARFDAPPEVLEADLRRLLGRLVQARVVAGDLGVASPPEEGPVIRSAHDLYLDLLSRGVAGLLAPSGANPADSHIGKTVIGSKPDPSSFSMIGLSRLENIRAVIERVLTDEVPGDLAETGVWRGGATIFMRGVLEAHGVRGRDVWVIDSFEGLPAPDLERFPVDQFWSRLSGGFAVSLEEVRSNFVRFGLLDGSVHFLKGWFKDTLPTAPIERLAVLRMDGDLYESTIETLTHLYPKLSPGGFVIIDDYCIDSCRQAVHDYRDAHAITAEIEPIDWASSFWRVPLA